MCKNESTPLKNDPVRAFRGEIIRETDDLIWNHTQRPKHLAQPSNHYFWNNISTASAVSKLKAILQSWFFKAKLCMFIWGYHRIIHLHQTCQIILEIFLISTFYFLRLCEVCKLTLKIGCRVQNGSGGLLPWLVDPWNWMDHSQQWLEFRQYVFQNTTIRIARVWLVGTQKVLQISSLAHCCN